MAVVERKQVVIEPALRHFRVDRPLEVVVILKEPANGALDLIIAVGAHDSIFLFRGECRSSVAGSRSHSPPVR